jgi:hypothetical protein
VPSRRFVARKASAIGAAFRRASSSGVQPGCGFIHARHWLRGLGFASIVDELPDSATNLEPTTPGMLKAWDGYPAATLRGMQCRRDREHSSAGATGPRRPIVVGPLHRVQVYK